MFLVADCFMSPEHDGVMEPIYQCRY